VTSRDDGPPKGKGAEREARLARALRSNLARRKSQARGRAAPSQHGSRKASATGAPEAGDDRPSGGRGIGLAAAEGVNQGLSPGRRLK